MCSTDARGPGGAERAKTAPPTARDSASQPPAELNEALPNEALAAQSAEPAGQPAWPPAGQLDTAIEDLAIAAQSGTADADDQLTDMLAAVWGLVAKLDPDLARRLDTYRG